jgi:hypothetical protein
LQDIVGGGKEIIPLGQWGSNPFKRSGGAHAPGRIHGHRTILITSPEQVQPTDEVQEV